MRLILSVTICVIFSKVLASLCSSFLICKVKVIFKSILQGLFWGRIFSPEPHRNNNINYIKKEISHSRMLFTGWITVVLFCLVLLPPFLCKYLLVWKHSFGVWLLFWFGALHCVAHHGLVGLFYPLAISGSFKGMLLKILVSWNSHGKKGFMV